MKRLSLKVKITLWFTAAILLVILLTFFSVLSVSDQILQKTIRDNLIETVENNFDEIRYFSDLAQVDVDQDTARLIGFDSGYLEINDDFLEAVNQVYTALYSADASLLYGENPVLTATVNLPFADSRIQTKKINGLTYYIFDRKLVTKGLDGFWIRGVVSETQGAVQMTTIVRLSLTLLLAILLVAVIGGYHIIKRMLRPVEKMSETARQIEKTNDLKKRITLDGGTDELHQLADTFNEMLDKLDNAFETERRFISDASHELRTPMSVISAQCEYSLEQPRTPEEYTRAFEVIQRQSRRMSRLIGDMLDFTRLEAGTDRYTIETVDLSALVSSICADMALIGESGIRLEYEVEPGISFVGNRELLARLPVNLISNAYRYGKPNGHIWVTLKRENKRICLTVSDDGVGIAKVEQEKIFRRFYRADSARSGAGVGLGLSMAAEIARFYGGEITVESALGRGSRFTVVL